MSIDIYKNASEEQKTIIDSTGGIFVNAVPGSGKTATASRLFINRVRKNKKKHSGIAFLSYSHAAVGELKSAISKIRVNIDLESYNFVGTLDSFADRYIINIFFAACGWLTQKPHFSSHLPKGGISAFDINNLQLSVNQQGDKLIFKHTTKKGEYKDLPYSEVKPTLIDFITKHNIYNHNLRWFLVHEILKNRNVCGILSERFCEFIIDEAQDTKVAALLALNQLKHNNEITPTISMIGDSNQSIYSFNDARVDLIGKFASSWRLAPHTLSISYRCSYVISKFINDIFRTNIHSFTQNQLSGKIFFSYGIPDESNYSSVKEIFNSDSIAPVRGRKRLSDLNFLPKEKRDIADTLFKMLAERDINHDMPAAKKALLSMVESKLCEDFLGGMDELCAEVLTSPKAKLDNLMGNSLFHTVEALSNSFQKLGYPPFAQFSQEEIRSLNERGEVIMASLREHFTTKTIHSTKGETYTAVTCTLTKSQSELLFKLLKKERTMNTSPKSEETRVLFVAFSRAREALHIIFSSDVPREQYNYILKRLPYIREI